MDDRNDPDDQDDQDDHVREPAAPLPTDYPEDYPGGPVQQRLLRAMTAYHARQPWALAFILFGSLARGDWDAYSDLDLDVVITDDARIEPVAEITRLCAALDATLGERAALIAPRRGDDGDIVLASLQCFSIRYHPLRATSPNIVSSLRLLWARIPAQAVRAAGLANAPRPEPAIERTQRPETLVARAVRSTLIGTQAVARGRRWGALAALEELRELLMTLWAQAHAGERPLQSFERGATPALQAQLAQTIGGWEPDSVRAALLAACDLLSTRLDAFGGGLARLSTDERAALAQIQAQIQALALGRPADDVDASAPSPSQRATDAVDEKERKT